MEPPSEKVAGVTVAGVTTAAAAAAAAPSRPIGEWLRTLDLYKTLFAYITMRMATNFTTLYMALYVTTTLAMDPELMLLDEPTQGMGHEDVDRVTQLIKKVGANRTILMVEHNMSVVSKIADTISVLQRGQVIAEGPYEVVSKNPQVLEAYMGTADNQLEGAHG